MLEIVGEEKQTWIDFRKSYDIVPHSWTLKTPELVGTATNIIELLKRSMQSLRTRRGTFQRDSLSPLLLAVALIPVTMILRTLKQGCSFRKG